MQRQPGQVLAAARNRAAVLGSPIGHSLSPVLHRAAYRAIGLDWTYRAIEVDAAHLSGFLAGLDDSWAGLSLTMPLKEAVLPLLDHASEQVRISRAANTVLLSDAGRAGHNTDVAGIVAAVAQAGPPGCGSVCIVGAGATARSALAAAAQLGARRAAVVARRHGAADELVEMAGGLGLAIDAVPWADAGEVLAMDLVISTVPGDAGASLVAAIPARTGLLLDVTYWPWPTSLASAWQAAGGTVVPGSQMLLWQAARQVELMTGHPAPVEAMRLALAAAQG